MGVDLNAKPIGGAVINVAVIGQLRLPTGKSSHDRHPAIAYARGMKTPLVPQPSRRRWFSRMLAMGAAATGAQSTVAAGNTEPLNADAPHKIVYQLNKADDAYQEAIFNSISAMLKKYVDDVAIVVVVWGPGIHLLARKPKRPVPPLFQQRVRSMAEAYGVKFVACGNTMHTIGWTEADMLDFVRVEDVGAAAVMELQEKGYAYLAW